MALFSDANGLTWYGSVYSDGSMLVEAVTTGGDATVEDSVTISDASTTYFGQAIGDPSTELDFAGTAADGTQISAAFRPNGTSVLTTSTETMNEFPTSDLGL